MNARVDRSPGLTLGNALAVEHSSHLLLAHAKVPDPVLVVAVGPGASRGLRAGFLIADLKTLPVRIFVRNRHEIASEIRSVLPLHARRLAIPPPPGIVPVLAVSATEGASLWFGVRRFPGRRGAA